MSVFRSMLFTPGNHPRRVEKVFQCNADAVILDLEDAVAIAEKEATRESVVAALKQPRNCLGYIRVNAYDTPYCYGDICAVVGPWLDGIILPKLETLDQLKSVDWLMAQLERQAGLPEGSIDLLPIIETGVGMANIRAIASAETRLKRLSFGAGDYTNDMNIIWTMEEEELAPARAEVALASRAGGLEPPLDTVFIHIRAHEEFQRSAERARRMGFQGKLCIHPDQVTPTNAAFTPSLEEVAHAEKVVAGFEAAEADGSASIQLDGYFIDYPIVYKAQRILDQMQRIRTREQSR